MKHTQMVKLSASEAVIGELYVLQVQLRMAGNEMQRFENEGGKTLSATQIIKRDDCFKSSLRIKKLMNAAKKLLSPIAA